MLDLDFKPTQNFKHDLFKAFKLYNVESFEELAVTLHYSYYFARLPDTVKMPHREVFGFLSGGEWIYQPTILTDNTPPIGFRHIKLYPNAPKFDFLSGWFSSNGALYVLGIFYLNSYGEPELYFPLHGNARNVKAGGRAYLLKENYPQDTNGSYAYSYGDMRNDIISRFGLDREDWR